MVLIPGCTGCRAQYDRSLGSTSVSTGDGPLDWLWFERFFYLGDLELGDKSRVVFVLIPVNAIRVACTYH